MSKWRHEANVSQKIYAKWYQTLITGMTWNKFTLSGYFCFVLRYFYIWQSVNKVRSIVTSDKTVGYLQKVWPSNMFTT
jgi:hypothetical protein